MGNYEKTKVNELNSISGNVKDFNQKIENIFYEETEDRPSKIAVYMIWKDKEGNTKKAIRSTYFSSFEDFKSFLFKTAEALGYFMRERGKLGTYPKTQLDKIVGIVRARIKKGIKKRENE